MTLHESPESLGRSGAALPLRPALLHYSWGEGCHSHFRPSLLHSWGEIFAFPSKSKKILEIQKNMFGPISELQQELYEEAIYV